MAWPAVENLPVIKLAELNQAMICLKPNKAPEPDEVSNEILKKFVELRPGLVMDTYNRCLAQGCFPTRWKTARLVLVRKGNKPPENPLSYRLLCMLNTTGKLFEKIIDTRIKSFLEKNNCLTANQYGFHKGHSTIDAIAKLKDIVDEGGGNVRNMVGFLTLDVRNVFNYAS